MVDGLWASGAFCVVDTAQQHTVDLMFADSLSHCCYNEPWVVREGEKRERSGKSLAFGCVGSITVCGVFVVSVMYRAYADQS